MGYNAVATDAAVDAWLNQYGYVSVVQMQLCHNLTADGFIGPKTIAAMERPRCGVSDFTMASECGWDKRELKYWNGRGGFSLFHDEMSRGDSKIASPALVDECFAAWAAVTDFKFERVAEFSPDEVDILVGGGRGEKDGFDGPGRTLGWAHLPCGDFDFLECRLDMHEKWTNDSDKRLVDPWVYARAVLLHEIGHILGLDHSDDPADLMAAYYNPEIVDLQPGDIARIRALYSLAA